MYSPGKFLLYLTGITAILIPAGMYTLERFFPDTRLPEYPWMVLFFAAATLLFHLYMIRVLKTVPRRFTVRFMAATGIKMLLYMMAAGLLLLVNPGHAVAFLLAFFVLYLLFTVFEVSMLVFILRRNTGK